MKKIITLALCMMMVVLFSGCQMISSERVRLRDLDFTIQSEETMPPEVLKMVKELKKEAEEANGGNMNTMEIQRILKRNQ